MIATEEAQTWDFNGFWNDTAELDPGVIDESAVKVFTRGHCHSLALALAQLIPDAELWGVWDGGNVADHVFVVHDGLGLDINGLADIDRIANQFGGFADELSIDDLNDWEDREWYRLNRADDAIPFARALIEREGIETPDSHEFALGL